MRFENTACDFSLEGIQGGINVNCDLCEAYFTGDGTVKLWDVCRNAFDHYYEFHYCDGCNHNAPHDCKVEANRTKWD